MKILLAGEIDGQIVDFYKKVSDASDGYAGLKHGTLEWCLCTGSFGTWPDKAKIDRGTRRHAGAGDFPSLYASGFNNSIQTVYISGVHEDHTWLKQRQAARNMEVLPNIHWLATGIKQT